MPDIAHLNILCYRWGTRYGVEYVNKLKNMVGRHLSVPHTFHCVTDSAAGLDPGIVAHELKDFGVAGNWNKLQTFRENFLDLQDQYIVCMDLDLVIVGSLDFLAQDPGHTFMIGRNWAKGEIRGNSSVYRLLVGSHTKTWDDFIADPEPVIDEFHGKTRLGGDQRWMNHSIGNYNYFPDGKIVSFKRHCKAKVRGAGIPLIGSVLCRIGSAQLPAGASVIAFTGDPLPPDVCDSPHGRWRRAPFVNEHWK